MKRNIFLIAFAILSFTFVDAQRIVSYGFESSENPNDGSCGFTGWSQSSDYNATIGYQSAEKARTGTGSLYVNNESYNGNFWERESVMQKIPVKENTSYRIVFYMKGDNSIKEGDDRGRMIFNSQIKGVSDFPSINAGPGKDFNMWDNMDFNSTTWTQKTLMVYYSTDAFLGNSDPGYIRLVWNLFSKGEFIIDDVTVDESTIAGVKFKDKMIEVDFGYKIDLNHIDPVGSAMLPLDAFTVKVNGVAVEAVSAHIPVQKLNIVLKESIQPTDNITIDFHNSNDDNYRLYYLEDKHPGFNDPNDEWSVKTFVGEKGEYDADLEFETLPEPEPEPIYEEILVNGNLEASVYTSDASKMVHTTNASEANGGSKYLKILPNTSANIFDLGAFLNAGAIEEGKEYTVSFWAKSVSGNPTNVGLSVLNSAYGTLNPDYSTWKTLTVASNVWTKYSYVFVSQVSEAAPIVSIQGGGLPNEVHIDDVSLQVKNTPSYIVDNRVDNDEAVFIVDHNLYLPVSAQRVDIYSITGNIVLSKIDARTDVLDVSFLKSGVYFVKINGLQSFKVFKK